MARGVRGGPCSSPFYCSLVVLRSWILMGQSFCRYIYFLVVRNAPLRPRYIAVVGD